MNITNSYILNHNYPEAEEILYTARGLKQDSMLRVTNIQK
jgi:hypothetical protein